MFDVKQAIGLFKGGTNIGVFTKSINTVDRAMSIVALSRLCSAEGKGFEVICPGSVRNDLLEIFQAESINVVQEPKSKNYIVSIDYSNTNIEKVICKRDNETNKLNFVITPGDELFSFDNVDLISGGGDYDVLFSIGVHTLEELNDEYKEIFENAKVISITKKESEIGDHKFLINGTKSYSEVIYEFYKAFSSNLSEEVLNILLRGIVARYKLLESENPDGWGLLSQLTKYGADPNQVFKDLYYSKSHENLSLQKKVFENMVMDFDSRIVWSKVDSEEVANCNVDNANLDIKGRISFNISKDFDIAFVVYHVGEDLVKVVLESNDVTKYSAIELAKAFDGYGSAERAVFTNKGLSAKGFVKRFVEVFKDVFKFTPTSYSSTVV